MLSRDIKWSPKAIVSGNGRNQLSMLLILQAEFEYVCSSLSYSVLLFVRFPHTDVCTKHSSPRLQKEAGDCPLYDYPQLINYMSSLSPASMAGVPWSNSLACKRGVACLLPSNIA